MAQLGLTNPVLPGEITQGGMLLALHPTAGTAFPVTSKPDTGSLPAGWRQLGSLAELPNLEMGIETQEVRTGIYGIVQARLFTGVSGKISTSLWGIDPDALSAGLGISPVTSFGVAATTTSGAFSVDSASGNSQVTVSDASGFSVGMPVVVDTTAQVGSSTNIGKIQTIASNVITMDRLLRQHPASSAAFKQLSNVMFPLGGLTPRQFSLACLIDFPDGRVMLVNFFTVQSSKAMTIPVGVGQEAIKTPVEFSALGRTDATYGVLVGKSYLWL